MPPSHAAKEATVHDIFTGSGRDALLIAIPAFPIMLMYVFRLDRLFAPIKRPVFHHRYIGGRVEHGEPVLTDPDGTIVPVRRRVSSTK